MTVIGMCLLLVVAGVAMVVRWGRLPLQPPAVAAADELRAQPRRPPATDVYPRWLSFVVVALIAGPIAGIMAAGAGGRVVMRLLAVTSPDSAQGQLTEAEAVVGRITTGGTVAFVLFVGVFTGLLTGGLYVLIYRWLPPGRLGGLAFGALLLVFGSTRVEPLRADNFDFAIVGPAWLAAVSFATLVLFHGMLVAAVAARTSRALSMRAAKAPAAAWETRRTLIGGRLVLAAAALAATPSFVSALADILARRG